MTSGGGRSIFTRAAKLGKTFLQMLAQKAGKAGRGLAVVLVEGGVGIDGRPEAFAQDELGVWNLQTVVELRAGRALNAMIRPQDLLSVVDGDGLEWTLAPVRRCKRAVAGRMPILRQHHVPEARCDAIDDRHDFVAARNGKLAARTEVILDGDHQQDVAFADRDRVGHRFASCACAMRPSTSAASRRNASLTSTGYDASGSSLRKGSGRRSSSRAACARNWSSVGRGSRGLPARMTSSISGSPG